MAEVTRPCELGLVSERQAQSYRHCNVAQKRLPLGSLVDAPWRSCSSILFRLPALHFATVVPDPGAGPGWRSHGLARIKRLSQREHGLPVVVRKSDASGTLNTRLGESLKDKRVARVWKDIRHIVVGLLMVLAVALAAFFLFVPIS